MSRGNFVEMMQQFADQSKSRKLYKKAEGLYLMRSFKITNVSSSEAIASYERLLNKYETQELSIQAHDWHKNQRKLFIWFLICYCQETKTSIQDLNDQDWQHIAKMFFHKSPLFLKFQGLSILKNTKRHIWTIDDDALLKKYVGQINSKQWNLISKSIFFEKDSGKFISAKQCRQRWFNHICQQVNKQGWTLQEDKQILKLTLQIGKKWSTIARKLNTHRTEHMVKNRFNSIINKIRRKKLQNEQSLTRKALQLYQKEEQMQQDRQKEQERPQKSQQVIIPEVIFAQNPKKIIEANPSPVKTKVKQNQEEQYNIADLPQGDLKDLRPLVNKRQKGCFTFNTDDTFQGQGTQAIVMSMTPNSVKAISPGFNNYFCNFQSFISSFDKQRRDDGSSLFSPACFSPANSFQVSFSPFTFMEKYQKQQKNSNSSSGQLLKNKSLQLPTIPSQLSCQYKTITKKQSKQQQLQNDQ